MDTSREFDFHSHQSSVCPLLVSSIYEAVDFRRGQIRGLISIEGRTAFHHRMTPAGSLVRHEGRGLYRFAEELRFQRALVSLARAGSPPVPWLNVEAAPRKLGSSAGASIFFLGSDQPRRPRS